jgi:hypothetical protein
MFNMLNTQTHTGKNTPWMCKFLVILSGFFRGQSYELRRSVHPLESMGVRNAAKPLIGLRIAFSTLQLVRIPLGRGKG